MATKTLLVKHAHTLVTMDEERRELADGAMFIRGPCIERAGSSAELARLAVEADEVLAQSSELFAWLRHLYPIWMRLDARGVYVSAQMTAAELLLSGCTTTSDHLYLFPNDCTLDDEIRALQELGMRFHASRGSMSVGESQGGLPPDALCESESSILKDSQRLIERYHDNARHAMTRMTLAPCSPFSVSRDLMRESAALARSCPGVRLHTHLAETELDVKFSRETFGMAPGDFAEDVGWTGTDVWHAHCVECHSVRHGKK